MLLPRLQPPLRATLNLIARSTTNQGPGVTPCIADAFAQLAISRTAGSRTAASPMVFKRYASHAQQTTVSKGKDGPGKRLGAKKSGEQYVIPGNIIFRQRGTLWFPGENCGIGRDHTIYALEPGYVKYYMDPERHPKRKYIGVTHKKEEVLPLPRNAMRRRRLGMVATEMVTEPDLAPPFVAVEGGARKEDVEVVEEVKRTKAEHRVFRRGDEGRVLELRPGYMYRESNWMIGRAAERAKVKTEVLYKPGNRWVAWRKRSKKRARAEEKKTLGKRISKR